MEVFHIICLHEHMCRQLRRMPKRGHRGRSQSAVSRSTAPGLPPRPRRPRPHSSKGPLAQTLDGTAARSSPQSGLRAKVGACRHLALRLCTGVTQTGESKPRIQAHGANTDTELSSKSCWTSTSQHKGDNTPVSWSMAPLLRLQQSPAFCAATMAAQQRMSVLLQPGVPWLRTKPPGIPGARLAWPLPVRLSRVPPAPYPMHSP